MTYLPVTHPFVLELGARVFLDESREEALRAARDLRVDVAVLYRAVHVMETVQKSGRSPWGLVWDAYILDGKMNGYVLIDDESPNRDDVRDECLYRAGIRF